MSGGPESKKQLGKILLQQKLVSADSLQEMLDDQKREPGSRLASTAARTGRVSMTDALRALSEQHSVPFVDLTEQIIPLATLRLIPIEIARERFVFPLRLEGEQLMLGMSSPDERELIEELEFLTAKKIQPFVGLHEVVRRVIEYAYAALERGQEHYIGAHVSDAQLRAHGLLDQPRAPDPLSAYPPPPGAAPQSSVAVAPAISISSPPESESSGTVAEQPPSALELRSVPPMLDAAFGLRMPPSQPPKTRALDADTRVLIAASDAALRTSLVEALERTGVTVLETDSGDRALTVLQTEAPRVLLLGASLHGMDGLEICHRLRQRGPDQGPAIIVLCEAFGGWRLAADLSESLGIKHCFQAPFDTFQLTRTVRLLLDGQAAPEETAPLSATAEASWSTAMEAFERGDLAEAIARLEGGVAIDPDAFELQYHLGLLYGRREQLFSAIRRLELAVELQPHHFSAIKNLAVVYQRVGFRYKAIDTWERARAAAPDDETRTNIKQHMVSLL
jgi:CheY-like chemotaxis protein